MMKPEPGSGERSDEPAGPLSHQVSGAGGVR